MLILILGLLLILLRLSLLDLIIDLCLFEAVRVVDIVLDGHKRALGDALLAVVALVALGVEGILPTRREPLSDNRFLADEARRSMLLPALVAGGSFVYQEEILVHNFIAKLARVALRVEGVLAGLEVLASDRFVAEAAHGELPGRDALKVVQLSLLVSAVGVDWLLTFLAA